MQGPDVPTDDLERLGERPCVDPQQQATANLEFWGKVPRVDKGTNLHPEKQLEALIVMKFPAFPMVHCGEISA